MYVAICFSTVRIVNNQPNTDPDYNTVYGAITASAHGDTIYICGSPSDYGNVNVNKRLTIIGPGYFLTENPHTQVSGFTARIEKIDFQSGSSGSVVTGMEIDHVTISASNLSLLRNYLNCDSGLSDAVVYIYSGHSNILIAQNYFKYNNPYSSSSGLIDMYGNNSGILISNNILRSYEGGNIEIPATSSATIENNVITGGVVVINNTLFQNNIQYSCPFTNGTANQVRNNLGDLEQFGSADGNQSNVTMSEVFCYTGSTDAQFMLLPGSPASGAGLSGVDCGAFGGPAPYVLSGMPADIPSIYELESLSSGFVLPLRIKAASH